MRDFRKYDIWTRGIQIAKSIYNLTKDFPKEERYGLSSQLTRAAISISSNIAEGCSRESDVDFKRFLNIALGSAFEIETQLYITREAGFIDEERINKLIKFVREEQKMISSLSIKLKKS